MMPAIKIPYGNRSLIDARNVFDDGVAVRAYADVVCESEGCSSCVHISPKAISCLSCLHSFSAFLA